MPEHSTKVFSGFDGLDISSGFSVTLGIARLVFIGVFMAGLWQNLTYLAILVLQAGSNFSSFASIPQPTFLRSMANACGVFRSTPVREHDIYVLKIQPREVSV